MKKIWMRCLLLALAAALALAGCTPRTEKAPDRESGAATAPESRDSASQAAPGEAQGSVAVADRSLAGIAGHVDLATAGTLAIARPEEDLELEAAAYYITGVSDPALPLTLDGEPVEDRGHLGSFAVYVELEWGENVFTFSQGEDSSETVTITRSEVEASTSTLTRLTPGYDMAARSGEETTITCTGPAGAAVSVEFQDVTVAMEQTGSAQRDGVPVTFTATLVPQEVDGTQNLGPVYYTLRWNGEERVYESDGDLLVAGSGETLLVRALDVSVATFQDPDTQDDYHTPLQLGAVDVVEEMAGSRYRLAMGGWVSKEAVEPLTDAADYHNTIADARYTVRESYEMLTLYGTSPAPFAALREAGALHLTFFHTAGPESLDLGGSALFSAANLLQNEDGSLTLSLTPRGSRPVGYAVSYQGGDTTILFQTAAVSGEGDQPLLGVTVLLDAGHGGIDDGASGVARRAGPVEKEITLDTAFAVQKYLESYGATVMLTRADDSSLDLSDRLAMVQQPGIDLMLSLHCNSIPENSDGTGIAGVEVHYFDEISQTLAQSVLDNLCDVTGRRSRGILHSYFKVILSANAPSVLVEMGFLTNPVEYDKLCEPQEIHKVAQAIADGVVEALRP